MKEVAKKKLSPQEQEAKMSVLKEIMDDMDSLMSSDLDKKKAMKVSVLAKEPKGLKLGLDQAESLIEGDSILPDSELGEDCGDSDLEIEDEDSALSSEDIDKKIAKLLSLKDQKNVKAPF